ncbi:hypothetical protein ACEWY4_002225 [Coilia grayii]|uniref:Non-muscle caldesmon n=1 Tax=Coilia grayii TaxID=363190 RepID=A0ABD1KV65_9TELE
MDDDFERRRELRRQKREEMRLEAERFVSLRNDDDDEEAARERRRRARQERLRGMDTSNTPESTDMNHSHSVSVSEVSVVSSSVKGGGGGGGGVDDEEEQALQERLAKREERRQRRLKEAQERQCDVMETQAPVADRGGEEERASFRRGRSYEPDPEPEPPQKEEDEVGEQEEEEQPAAEEKERDKEVQREVEKPRRSYRQVSQEEEDGGRKELASWAKQQNGGLHDDTTPRHKKPERTVSRGSLRSPEAGSVSPAEERGLGLGGGAEDEEVRLEAERKLEELRRKRDETESEGFERMRQKQQEAEAELEELKRKREERRKVLQEEERVRRHEEEERRAREEEEKRRMKEEIERRRAEAAEKRQKAEETDEGEVKSPFKCISPRGSSLKIGERAEFLNKSAQKSAVKASHTPVVSKIDNRLEQYTSAAQSKDARSPRSGAIDLPVVTDGIRSIKSMWEKGHVFNANSGAGSTNKDAAGIKVGVAGRINDWLNKTPESGKSPGGRPVDLKPGDVTGKRSLWENIGSSPAKTSLR